MALQLPFLSLLPILHIPSSKLIPYIPPRPSLLLRARPRPISTRSVGPNETELTLPSSPDEEEEEKEGEEEEEEEEIEPTPEDLEYIEQIKRVLDLLKKNRDMFFGEVKLTVMIEDPRDTERKILLGIEDPDDITRDDYAAALEDVYEGRVPKNRVALRLLAEEMINWPDLEVEAPKKGKPQKSLYAKATDTGIDPREAARRLNMDWDSAADIESEEDDDEIDVPPVLGYGALYLVTALPVIIGISVVLILFYNSLQ